jgi:nitrogen regulatory protein PII
MKMIVAVVRPHKLQDVKDALLHAGATGLSVTEVRGHGRQRGHVERYRGAEYTVELLPKVRIETVVVEEQVEDVVQAIASAARTGEIGDGKVFVLPVEESVRIRTGDRGEQSL